MFVAETVGSIVTEGDCVGDKPLGLHVGSLVGSSVGEDEGSQVGFEDEGSIVGL